ncbi:UDP-GlcNAc:betaGal beta-1,3-N-acetylglucosaminyltransferase-like protein 1 [Cymbomonas tetramitiformis]|uniref:UDP-GlcNAc:betaGal beta-1,3-N-acetylglucosaminyltransferase-like protein 1 n=1 Tax=Cymbomonas tetramitiformis TaxID=36881 RepID=A0AAE0LGD1_9CHLO|nr:UDP-GlcNAc:betaGal beta-1,3-N-acetylglucosaminyltransferase-like protein 1 [Cymbomonas tetramitiformis]
MGVPYGADRNAGKEGRRLYKSLSSNHQSKVIAFCDVDDKKLAQGVYEPYPEKRRIPIVHFTEAKPPLILCVKGDLTGGQFEANIASLNLQEGHDFIHFS